jgi:hypothetical protein
MPRPPKAQSLNNSLRKLREHLGTGDKPMTQRRMAEILKLPLETYKSIESGRFRDGIPSPKTFDIILERFGAVWSPERQQWESSYPGLPFTRKNYELWKNAQFDRVKEADALCNGLISLLLKVSDKQFASLSDAVYRELYRLARVYGVSHELVPNVPYVDEEFTGMDLIVSNISRSGNLRDIIQLRRERGRLFRNGRELLDFRYRTESLKNPPFESPIKPLPIPVLPKVEPLRRPGVVKTPATAEAKEAPKRVKPS